MVLKGFSSRTDPLFLGARKAESPGGRAQRALHWPLLLLLLSPSPHPIGLSHARFFPQNLARHCRCLCASAADPFDRLVLFCVLALLSITGTMMIWPCKASDIYRSTYL